MGPLPDALVEAEEEGVCEDEPVGVALQLIVNADVSVAQLRAVTTGDGVTGGVCVVEPLMEGEGESEMECDWDALHDKEPLEEMVPNDVAVVVSHREMEEEDDGEVEGRGVRDVDAECDGERVMEEDAEAVFVDESVRVTCAEKLLVPLPVAQDVARAEALVHSVGEEDARLEEEAVPLLEPDSELVADEEPDKEGDAVAEGEVVDVGALLMDADLLRRLLAENVLEPLGERERR